MSPAVTDDTLASAARLHERVPPDWYERSIRENVLQRFWHRRRFAAVRRVIEPVRGRVLDIGSADGTFTGVIAEASSAREVVGIDALAGSVVWANARRSGARMSFQVGDAHDIQFPDASFDAVFALEVLEHVHDPARVFSEVRRVTAPGGYAVFLVPSDSLLFRCIWWLWTRWRGSIWADTHIQTFRGKRLTREVRAAGFDIEIDRAFLLGMLHLVKVRTPRRIA